MFYDVYVEEMTSSPLLLENIRVFLHEFIDFTDDVFKEIPLF